MQLQFFFYDIINLIDLFGYVDQGKIKSGQACNLTL